MNRRKEVGEHFSRVLMTQLRIIQTLEEKRQAHRIQFDALFKEIMKCMEWIDALILQTSSDPAAIKR